MNVLILAGGKGTRLRNVTNLPKPMVDVCSKPILERQIEKLEKQGFREIILSTGYKADKIHDHFGDGSGFGVNIKYSHEEEPLGTGGAIKRAEKHLDQDFLLLFGDLIFDMDLGKLVDFHLAKQGLATITVHETDHPWDSDLVELDKNGLVTKLHKKPNKEPYPSQLSKTSIYILSKNLLKYMAQGKHDLEKHVLDKFVKKGKVFGYKTSEFIKDIGTPERLEMVRKRFR